MFDANPIELAQQFLVFLCGDISLDDKVKEGGYTIRDYTSKNHNPEIFKYGYRAGMDSLLENLEGHVGEFVIKFDDSVFPPRSNIYEIIKQGNTDALNNSK
jgi:hypothetical protein